MPDPRGVEDRIDWFLSHNPSGSGMCAQHTWHSLGGDRGNPPAWGCSDANECVSKIRASGRYWTPSTWSGPPPRGAVIGYEYGEYGHLCLSLGDGRIATTDPSNGSGKSGIEDIDYPNKWGASGWDVWTDQYAGVRFDVEGISHGDVYLSKLVYGQMDSDSVRRLQAHLNDHPLANGGTLPITGNLLDETAEETRLCREQHGFPDQVGDNFVSEAQVRHIIPFETCGCVLHVDTAVETPDPPEPPEQIELGGGIVYHYSGKPSGELSFSGSYKALDVDEWAPPVDGYTFGMLYANVAGAGEFRTRLVRGGSEDDETAYQTHYAAPNGGGDNYLLTHVWFEKAEGKRPLRYEFCAMDGDTFKVGTRYAKFFFIPESVLVDLGGMSAVIDALSSWVARP